MTYVENAVVHFPPLFKLGLLKEKTPSSKFIIFPVINYEAKSEVFWHNYFSLKIIL